MQDKVLRSTMWVFDKYPVSDEAHNLVNQLFISLKLGRKKNKRNYSQQQLKDRQDGFGRVLCSLIYRARHNPEQKVYRSSSRNDFSKEAEHVSCDLFMDVVTALLNKQYITRDKGGYYPSENFDNPDGSKAPPTWHSTKASQYTVTQKFIKLCGNKYGLGKKKLLEHFGTEPPKQFVDVRYPNIRYGRFKYSGPGVSKSLYTNHPRYKAEMRDMKALNTFLFDQEIKGAEFTGLRRIFNNFTEETYNWDKGARISSFGSDSYQSLSKEQRSKMTINGEPVVEIDITACHFTILLSLLGERLPNHDPYDVFEGFPRKVIKSWMTVTLSNATPCTRMPPKVREKLVEAGYDLKGVTAPKIKDAVQERYP